MNQFIPKIFSLNVFKLKRATVLDILVPFATKLLKASHSDTTLKILESREFRVLGFLVTGAREGGNRGIVS